MVRSVWVFELVRLWASISILYTKRIYAWAPLALKSRPLRLSLTTNLTSDVHPECKFCNARFPSRNSLFRHLNECSLAEGLHLATKRYTLRINFGYICNDDVKCDDLNYNIEAESQQASQNIQNALHEALETRYTEKSKNFESVFQVLTKTQSSVSRQRHRSLAQEYGCAARSDVMTISFSYLDDPKFANNTPMLVNHLNSLLQNDDNSYDVRIHDVLLLDHPTFHAESSCSQYIYRYLMPIWWLNDGDTIVKWLIKSDSDKNQFCGSGPTPPCLKLLKQVLKTSESITIPNRRVRRNQSPDMRNIQSYNRKIEKIGKRKMGTISNKERRCQHNFVDSRLQGDASPNQEPVWRIIDRARIVGTARNALNDEINLVIEFKGDSFLPHQIRRIVGTAVACTNSWLPLNIFEIATRPDTVLETVLAPSGRLYLYDVRFHSEENCTDRRLHGTNSSIQDSWIHQKLFRNLSMHNKFATETAWIEEVENKVSPRIRSHILQLDPHYTHNLEGEILKHGHTPDMYIGILSTLRNIAMSGWPKTSVARSKLIRNIDTPMKMGENPVNVGSFTVVNPVIFQPPENQSLPLGNQLFPDLVPNVFQLEAILSEAEIKNASGSKSIKRKPSTHCAVNFNANFKPHVDSGIGLGQSLSMIVGLGDYSGGDIFVEGEAYSIRYEPLEFDGWNQRHWTGSYIGERFSLVWFTPDTTTVPYGTKDEVAPIEEVVLSKTQMKRQKRREEIAKFRKAKAIEAKDARKAKAQAQGRDIEAEQKQQREKTLLGEGKRRRDEEWAKTMKSAHSRFRIAIDCSFDDMMTYKEKCSLARQIQFCYAANKASKNSVFASVLCLSEETQSLLEKSNGFPYRWKDRGFDCTNKDDILMMYPDKTKLVYLTSDSSQTLENLDDDKIYVIGGIVDRNRLKKATFAKATELGIASARLPIDEHLKVTGTQVLTVNHVFEILLKFCEHNDWKKALLEVIPYRKGIENFQ